MRLPNLLPLLALLPLAACITTQDQLLRSNTAMPLPLGAIHVPPRDSGIVLQGSLAVSVQAAGRSRVELVSRNGLLALPNAEATSSIQGPSTLETSRLQMAAEGSAFLSEHLRLGGGIDASGQGKAAWGEIGGRWGKNISVETFLAVGAGSVKNDVLWNLRTVTEHDNPYSGIPMDTIVTDTLYSTATRSWQRFMRGGVHVALRNGGPFAEYQLITTELLSPSPKAGDLWGAEMHLFGAGWSQPTDHGTATAYVRALYTGKTVIPSLGVQWTGEIKLGG